jgi:hypothetical protein
MMTLTAKEKRADKYLAQCMREQAAKRRKLLRDNAPALLEVLQEIMGGQLQGQVDLQAPRFQRARELIAEVTGRYEPREIGTPWVDVAKRLLAEWGTDINLGYCEYKHLIARTCSKGKAHGRFLVHSLTMVLDRQAFKEIVAEARKEQLDPPYFIYGTICTYAGPNIEFVQIDVD